MRVPLTPQDLKPRRGFKQIAKIIKREWISTSPITLAESQELLARCLGYYDYHDVLRESEREQSTASLLSLQGVRSNSYRVVATALAESSHLSEIDAGQLLRYIQAWPLHELTIYRVRGAGADDMTSWRRAGGMPPSLPMQGTVLLHATFQRTETVFGICPSFTGTPPLSSYRITDCLTCQSLINANLERSRRDAFPAA